jgi:aldose 1-epimerase
MPHGDTATSSTTSSPDPATFVPSGEQVELALGDQRLVIVEVGGGIRSYSVAGVDILDGYRIDEMASSGRGQVLIPWPNRIRDGTYEFDGITHHVPWDEPEQANAIHGLVRWTSWTIADRDAQRVVMEHALHPQPGYPFALRVRIEYALSETGLAVTTMVTNVGPKPCPFGAGAHPWLLAGAPQDDTVVLHVPAAAVLHNDERGIPVETARVDGTDLDFRGPAAIGPTRMDHAFTDLARDKDGLARVTVRRPDGIAVAVWFDQHYPYVMLTTGDVLPDVDRRSLAVEPMTCPPNAFQTGDDVIELDPGDAFTGRWGISVRVPDDHPTRDAWNR